MKFEIILLLSLVNIVVIHGSSSRYCVNQDTCEKCLDQHSSCVWCTDRNYDMRQSRCMSRLSDLKAANCRDDFILENKYKKTLTLRSDNLRDFDPDVDSVQIQPQHLQMSLRKGRQQIVKMKYKPARNYPLDLYYLMDLTYSMKDDKKTLVGMGGSLSQSLSNLTENVRVGFGSFADKAVMPFINLGTEENPCKLARDKCQPTYGFKHKLKLTDNIQEFISKVNSSEITANLDNLEGGLDALMQIIVCQDEIGWKEKTRKMVVLATDGFMHFAGDGLIGGLVKKNDKKCHLNEEGDYTASLEFDYPSLEEIYRELVRSKISVIFAVTSDVIHHYDQIREVISEITSVGRLAADSSNILQLVEIGYKKATQRAHFKHNAPDYVKVEIRTTCGGKFDKPQAVSKCDNIEIGNEYIFDIGVTLLRYPDDETKNVKIKIEEATLHSEGMEIDIEIDYPCLSCLAENSEPSSALCGRHGEFKCGSCICDKGFVGKTCDCNLQEYSSTKELDNQCREPKKSNNETIVLDNEMCSDRGECLCGECLCNQAFRGKYCEFDPCTVDKTNYLECGGRGSCNAGQCECYPDWTGSLCECSTLQTNCIAPGKSKDAQICSNRGTCECNQCECHGKHHGKFCESSPLSDPHENSLCLYYESCVQCIINRRLQKECSDYENLCSEDGRLHESEFFHDISDADITCISRVRYDEDTVCEYKFTYNLDDNGETFLQIADDACPPPHYAAYAIGTVVLATLLIGIAIIMFVKCNMYLADKREYAKFEEERKKQTEYQFESPIYRSPITRVNNPQLENRPTSAFELQ